MISLLVLLGLIFPSGGEASPLAKKYSSAASHLIETSATDSTGWERLAFMGDHFPSRLSGSKNLEKCIAWVLETMKKDGLENVRGEKVMVPHWVRGKEEAAILEPARHELNILGLGNSVGTGKKGITAEVLVVKSFDELKEKADQAKGKIVLYNVVFDGYGKTVRYRSRGASEAAKLGAVAALVRSVGPYSMSTPHTGMLRYEEDIKKIPAAAVTLEEAEMMQRMQDRGETVKLHLMMEAHFLPDAESYNVVAEIRGREKPEEIVVLGGHIDSWDTGPSIMDDAGGCVAAWEALRLIKQMDRPRRTIRVVLWTNEENGLRGGRAYRDQHRAELDKHVLAMESDSGVFQAKGFGFSGPDAALERLREIGALLEPIQSGEITKGGGGADIGPIMREGVPGMGLRVDTSKYFHFHHTHADTLDKVKPEEFSSCVATLAVMAYVVADMEENLRHLEPSPSSTE